MGYSDKSFGALRTSISLGALTLTAANETATIKVPSALSVPLLQRNRLTRALGPAEVWRPIGVYYIVSTGITVNAAVLILRKNGVSALTSAGAAGGGLATLPIVALSVNILFAAFTDYTFAAADAAGDAWSVLVSTTSTAGICSAVHMAYAAVAKGAITDGVTL